MDWTLITNALGLTWHLALPFVLIAVLGAFIAGFLQVATQVQDDSIGFAGKLFAIILALYLFGAQSGASVIEFAQRIWGGAEFYQ